MAKEKKEDKQNSYNSIVDQLTANTKELLVEYYARADALRDAKDTIKIQVAHRVSHNEFGEVVTNSKIAFGKRVRDEVEHTVDLTGQLDFEGKTKQEPADTSKAAA